MTAALAANLPFMTQRLLAVWPLSNGKGLAVRLGELVMYGLVAGVMLSLGLGFLAILLTVILWDNNRLLALGVFATVFLTLGVVFGLAARRRLNSSPPIWSATVKELERDKERLRP